MNLKFTAIYSGGIMFEDSYRTNSLHTVSEIKMLMVTNLPFKVILCIASYRINFIHYTGIFRPK